MKCLARLTSWETTNSPIGESNKRSSSIKLCKNTPQKGILCEECSNRPTSGKYQTRMLHGLLTEPPPSDSHVYGSTWYWQRVSKYGDPIDTSWISSAKEAQRLGEERCALAGCSGWKIKRPDTIELEKMKHKKVSYTLKESKGTLLESFAPVKVMYEESDKVPEKLPTDTVRITKKCVGDIYMWITESGMVFDCDSLGEPGEYMGRMVDGILEIPDTQKFK